MWKVNSRRKMEKKVAPRCFVEEGPILSLWRYRKVQKVQKNSTKRYREIRECPVKKTMGKGGEWEGESGRAMMGTKYTKSTEKYRKYSTCPPHKCPHKRT